MTETPDRTESIFATAAALASAERDAYLDQACAGDAALRGNVEALLRAHERAGHLLDRPAPGAPEKTGTFIANEQQGTVIAGRYKLLEEIGEGGMGTVWVAEQTQPVKRKVALKLIKAGMDSKSVLARFEAERQALAVMDHPNIAKVLDGGLTETGRPFFIMEYVKGIPITEYCDATRLNIPERLQLFAQVCSAVQHAHQKGIIHRDLKPSNILVAPYDDKPVPKVIDFGLAKAIHQSLTERTLHTAHEAVLGTPLYMSPEQAQLNNLDVDTRADIYSLGVLLYELLTGTTPLEKQRFKEAAWDEIKRLIREEEPPRPSTRLSSSQALPSLAAGRQMEPARLTKLVRGELDWIVMKSLEKDRGRRYETANGFAMDVQRFLAGEPVLAVPPSAGYRLRKFVRKHRVALTTAAALTLLLAAGVVAVVTVQLRANRDLEAKNAELAEEQAKVEQRFEVAQKAIAMLHTGVSQDMLLKSDQFKDLRTQLLKEAARFYGELERLLEGQSDAKSRRLLAEGYFQLARLTWQIGSKPEALAVARKALAVRRDLAALPGADVEMRLDVARSLGALGYLLIDTGDTEGALRAFAEQREVAETLAAESSTEAVQTELAMSFSKTAVVLWFIGKSAEAQAANDKALAIQRKMVEVNPNDTDLQYSLATNLVWLDNLLKESGMWAESLATMENARAILEKLTRDKPANTAFWLSLNHIHENIADNYFIQGRLAESLAAAEKARAITRKLAETYAAVTPYQKYLAADQSYIARALAEMGKPAEAMATYQESLAIWKKLAEANPTDMLIQFSLGWCYNEIGQLLAQMGKPEEALEAHLKARSFLVKPIEINPAFHSYQDELARSLDKTGQLLLVAGNPEEALAFCQKALTIRQKLCDAQPKLAWLRIELANSLTGLAAVQRRTGQPAKAVASLRRAVALVEQLPMLSPRNYYDLARCHAELAWVAADAGSGMTAEQGSAEAERSMADLRQAVAAGFNAVGRLHSDASLDTLRPREDFQKLLKELDVKVSKMLNVAPRN